MQPPRGLPNGLIEADERLSLVEQAWGKARVEARKAALPALLAANKARLLSDYTEQVRWLDEALWTLRGEKPTPALRTVMSLRVTLLPPIIDTETRYQQAIIGALYSSKEFFDFRLLRVRWLLVRKQGKEKEAVLAEGVMESVQNIRLVLPAKLDADEEALIVAEISLQGKTLRRIEARLAFVKDLFRRVEKLHTDDRGGVDLAWATVRELEPALNSLNMSMPTRHIPHLVGSLQQAEAALAGKPLWGARQPGEFSLTFYAGVGAKMGITLFAPPAVQSGKPLPLVIALTSDRESFRHALMGHSGSLLREGASRRGWLVASMTREGINLNALLETIEKLYPVDRQRIYLLCYDQGMRSTSFLLARSSQSFAAMALVGLGGGVSDLSPLPVKPKRLFWAVGEHDASREQVLKLAGSLGATIKQYPNCEPLMTLPEALPEVLRFFESTP